MFPHFSKSTILSFRFSTSDATRVSKLYVLSMIFSYGTRWFILFTCEYKIRKCGHSKENYGRTLSSWAVNFALCNVYLTFGIKG